jgi:hypothetical protein
MATSIQEYLRRAEQDPMYAGRRETQDIRNALQAISSYQTSKAVGETLGVDAEAQPKKGLVTRIVGDVLGAPSRAVRAGIADIVGFNDPRLRQQGVLGSAVRGFTGDIDITGGDFIDADRARGRLGRAARLAGAFAIDVATDPLTYLGTPAALGRKAASIQAAYGGAKIFKSAVAARSKATGEAIEVAEKALRDQLFTTSATGQQLRGLSQYGLTDEQIALRLEQLGGQKFVNEVAERELGSLVGESLWAEGRQGIINNLTTFFAGTGGLSDDVARAMADDVFKGLGNRVKGGVYLVNPLTGQEIGRITQGTGESLGALGAAVNKARAQAAAFTGRASKSFSGEFGEAFQMIREDLAKYGAQAAAPRQMTLANYVGAKEMRRVERMANAGLNRQFINVTSEATLLKRKHNLSDEQFNELLLEGVLNPNAVKDGVAAEVHAVGVKMAYGMRGLRERLIASGVDVGDLGETYLPLVATREGATFFDKAGNLVAPRTQAVGATGTGAVGFKTERGRDSYFRNIADLIEDPSKYGTVVKDNVALKPELANIAVAGEQMQQFALNEAERASVRRFFDQKIDLAAQGRWSMPESPLALAKELKDEGVRLVSLNKAQLESVVLKPFETDMIKIMSAYYSGAAPRIARREMIDAGLRSGVLQARDGVTTKQMTDRVGRQWMVDYIETASPLSQNPKIKALLDAGKLDGETLSVSAMLDEQNLSQIITNAQLDRNLPNTAAQAAVVEDAIANVAALHRIAKVPDEQLAIIRQAADQMESLDNFISSMDEVIGEFVEAGLSSQDIADLIDSAKDVLTKVNADDPTRLARLFGTEAGEIVSRRAVLSPTDELAARFGFERLGAAADVPGVVSLPTDLQEFQAIRGVRNLIEERHRVQSNPTAIEKFFKEVYDPAFLTWKTGATVGRGPGYTFLNMVGNLYMNHLGGVSAADHKLAARVVQLARESAKEASDQAQKQGTKVAAKDAPMVLAAETDAIFKRKLAELPNVEGKSMYELMQDFVDAGGIDSSQIGEALNVIRRTGAEITPEALGAAGVVRNVFDEAAQGRVGKSGQYIVEKLMNNPYQRFANSVNTNVETWTRFAAYIDGYRATQSIDAALDRMFLLQFDYGDLAAGDRMARRVFPFYVWTRNNVPAQIRAMFVQPGKIRRFMYAQNAFKDAVLADDEDAWLQQVLPEYIGEAGGFASRIKSADGDNVAFAGKLPYHDIERLFQVGGRFGLITLNRREIAQMFGPFTLGLEAATGVDVTTGGKLDPRGVEATGWRSALGAVPGVGRTGAYGERRIPQGLERLTSDIIPQIGTAERALTGAAYGARRLGAPEGVARAIEAPAGATMRQRGISNLLNVSGVSPLLGVSATTLTPRTISSSVRGRSARQQAVISEAAGRMQVSEEWVRQELRKGFTPEQIAVRIAQGEGRLEDWEAEQDARQRPPSQRYGTILEDLRRGPEVRSLGYPPASPGPALFGGR